MITIPLFIYLLKSFFDWLEVITIDRLSSISYFRYALQIHLLNWFKIRFTQICIFHHKLLQKLLFTFISLLFLLLKKWLLIFCVILERVLQLVLSLSISNTTLGIIKTSRILTQKSQWRLRTSDVRSSIIAIRSWFIFKNKICALSSFKIGIYLRLIISVWS
jgi:hypothetical protein